MRGFTPFAGAILACAPDKHIEVIVSGIAALTDEINWFKSTAEKKGIDLANTGKTTASATIFIHHIQLSLN